MREHLTYLHKSHGRAGREGEDVNVIIQTYNPDNFTLECAREQNYMKFYNQEIELRKVLKYPPFCDIIKIDVSDYDEITAMRGNECDI